MNTTKSEQGELRELLRGLVKDVGVRVAFVCEPSPQAADHARILALYKDGQFMQESTYPMKGTPCEHVYSRKVLFHSHGVKEIYPEDEELQKLDVDNYLGVAILDEEGSVCGHVGVMHDQPLEDPAATETKVRGLARNVAELLTVKAD